VKPRVVATIHYNIEVDGSRQQTGAFEFAEFAKLMKDFESSRVSPAKGLVPCYFVMYATDNTVGRRELCLFFNRVESIERRE
jgi:hypothetical protein